MSEKRPLVAITPSCDGIETIERIKMSTDYLAAVWDAGGNPVLLQWADPRTPEGRKKICEYAYEFDAFLFGGGCDLDPMYYGEEIAFDSVSVCEKRDAFELGLFKEVYEKTKKPILGICRGEQLINVAMGGSLHQHIDGHNQKLKRCEREQTVRLRKGTLTYDIISPFCATEEEIKVNTFHHQAVKAVGNGLCVTAMAEDGTVEGVEGILRDRMLVGVQWHPECFYKYDEGAAALFRYLVNAAKKQKQEKEDT